MVKKRKELTKTELKEKAPAIFATEPAERTTDNYLFIPTTEIIKEMKKHGFVPVDARQAMTVKRDKNNKVIDKSLTPYARHEIRFAHPDIKNERYGGMPELLLITGHNGLVGLRAFLGYHISVCSNGLVSGEIEAQIQAIHRKNIELQIKEQLLELFQRIEKEEKQIKRYQTIELKEVEKNKFAVSAHDIRFGKNSVIKPQALLQVNRPEDDNNTLWSVFNTVQENTIIGGLPIPVTYKASEKSSANKDFKFEAKTRPITQIDRKTAINIGLWNLMAQFANKK